MRNAACKKDRVQNDTKNVINSNTLLTFGSGGTRLSNEDMRLRGGTTMRTKNVKKIGMIALCTATSLTVMAYSPDYIVKKGDTLSKIALTKLKGGPLYGEEGRLTKLLLLNPEVKNPNLIEPGTEIKLRATVADLDKSLNQAKTIAAKTEAPALTDETKVTQAAPERKSFDYLLTDKKDAKKFVAKIGAGISFNTLDLIDNKTKEVDSISSTASLNATAEAKYLISEKASLNVKAHLLKMDLTASGNESTSLASSTYLSGEFGADYKALNKLVTGLRIGATERAFVTNKTASIFRINKAWIPTLGPELRILLDENEDTASSIQLGYRILGSTTLQGLQIERGQEIRTGFELIRDSFNFNPYVNWTSQNTALLDQDGLALGLNINYKF